MRALGRDETRAVAELASLDLDDREVEQLSSELGQILEHMEKLAEVDTAGVEPMTHAVPTPLKTRPDEREPSLPASRAVGAAPDREGDYFRVPRVLERRGEEKR